MRAIVTPLNVYAGLGGVGGAAGQNNGGTGEYAYVKENGSVVLRVTGGQGGFAAAVARGHYTCEIRRKDGGVVLMHAMPTRPSWCAKWSCP